MMGKRKDNRNFSKTQEAPEFEQKIIDLARVTRVMAGGKRMRFRACVAIGDMKGRVGLGLAKGADVTLAVNKAVNKAKRAMIQVPILRETVPHEVRLKLGAAKLLLKPAPKGTGIKVGGPMRVILELAGVPNAVGKILGTNNKINNASAMMELLTRFKVSSADLASGTAGKTVASRVAAKANEVKRVAVKLEVKK